MAFFGVFGVFGQKWGFLGVFPVLGENRPNFHKTPKVNPVAVQTSFYNRNFVIFIFVL